ncbi:MAG: DMT family transporter [Planctomycetota bacterium]
MSQLATENPRRAYFLIVLASALFSAMFAVVKILPARVASSEVLCLRGLIGVTGAGLVIAVTGQRWRPGPLGINLMRSGCGFASVLTQYYSVHEAGAELATANLLVQGAPLWIVLLSAALLGERPSRRTKWALAAGLAGTALALGPSGAGERTGLLLALVSGGFSALALLSVRKLASTESPASVVLFFMGFSALAAAPFALPSLYRHGMWTAHELAALVAIGVLGTAGQLVMTEAYRYGSAASVSIAGLSQVAFSALLSFGVLGAPAPSIGAIAGGIIVLAAGLVSVQPWRAAATTPARASGARAARR